MGLSTMPASRKSLIDRDIALRWSRVLALSVGLIGILVLVGWFFDLWYLKSVFIRSMTMKPNTAAASSSPRRRCCCCCRSNRGVSAARWASRWRSSLLRSEP